MAIDEAGNLPPLEKDPVLPDEKPHAPEERYPEAAAVITKVERLVAYNLDKLHERMDKALAMYDELQAKLDNGEISQAECDAQSDLIEHYTRQQEPLEAENHAIINRYLQAMDHAKQPETGDDTSQAESNALLFQLIDRQYALLFPDEEIPAEVSGEGSSEAAPDTSGACSE